MGSLGGMNDKIDKQTLEEMTRFDPSPDIKNIMVTGGNGFVYVTAYLCAFTINHHAQSIHTRSYNEIPKANKEPSEVLGSFEPSLSPIKTITTSSPLTSSIMAPH